MKSIEFLPRTRTFNVCKIKRDISFIIIEITFSKIPKPSWFVGAQADLLNCADGLEQSIEKKQFRLKLSFGR